VTETLLSLARDELHEADLDELARPRYTDVWCIGCAQRVLRVQASAERTTIRAA
jgi:hypothetical protein